MYTFCDTMNRYIHLFSSESERSMWTASGSFLRDKWSSEDDELAGPSHTVSSRLHGMSSSYFYYKIS